VLTPLNESYALSQVDFARGEISASEYQMGVAAATIGAAGSALPTRGVAHKPLSFSLTKLTDAARLMEQTFEQMVQRRSQKPVFVYAKHDKTTLLRRSSSAGALHDHSWFFENRGDGGVQHVAPKSTQSLKPGTAIRQDAIPEGSKLEYLGPGRVRFDGVEFRVVRDLSHLDKRTLQRMIQDGVNPKDISGKRLDGHHFNQLYHRDPGAFVVEIPEPSHCISNFIQHPFGTSGGLSKVERQDWNNLRKLFNKERAKTELLRRNLLND
jgi:hypothetical protein